jgi:hypothetical protein
LAYKPKYLFAFAAGIICFIIYMLTLYPGVTFMDSGELGGALYTFGVPHPTGYPLYLVIGYVVSNLPFLGTPIYKLNVLSAIFSSAAIVVLYFVIYNLLVLINSFKETSIKHSSKANKGKEKTVKTKQSIVLNNSETAVLAFFASIVIGVSRTFWNNATFIEVYPLHELFISLILLVCVRIYVNSANPKKRDFIYLFLLLGLSFANHMTTLLLIPGVLYLLWLQKEKSKLAWKIISSSMVYIVPGLLFYLILIIRASAKPFFNWSDPQNFSNLLYHVTGGDYSQAMFSGGSGFINNIKIFASGILGEYAVIASILGIIGIGVLYKRNRQLFIFMLILMISSLIYAFNYRVRDIEVYFIQFYIIFGICVAVGMIFIVNLLIRNLGASMKPALIITISGFVITSFGFYYNYSYNDNSTNYAVEDFTMNTINSIEQNGIFITYDWGYSYPAALYYQQAEHKRQDLKIFNAKFLSVPWYLENIKKYYPDVYKTCSTEIEDYIKSYNSGDNKSTVIGLNNLIKTFILRNSKSFPVYLSVDVILNKEIKSLLAEADFIPNGLSYRVREKSPPYDKSAGVETLNYVYRPYSTDTPDKQKINSLTAGMYFETGYYHYINKNTELALKFADKSLSVNSGFKDALNLKNKILSGK